MSESVPNSIWALPGLDKTSFFAAAYYLSKEKRQQRVDKEKIAKVKRKANREGPQSDEGDEEFLDRLAEIFARKKDGNSHKHVTATALVKQEHDRKLTIVIAKNYGPDDEDEEFREFLGRWLNERLSESLQENMELDWNDSFWTYIQNFSSN
ncbi:hypothetical protein MMC20_002222 [Loxospora ochrophaea]|nr:hypothetical protein [Loxospora ochrophaea]